MTVQPGGIGRGVVGSPVRFQSAAEQMRVTRTKHGIDYVPQSSAVCSGRWSVVPRQLSNDLSQLGKGDRYVFDTIQIELS
jgi:hypothetical protein